jgi:hypothetical protein
MSNSSNIANASSEEEKQLIREKREKRRIDSQIKAILNDPYYRQKQVSKYPRNIYYSKLLIDEKKRPKELQGILCIQPNERKLEIYQNIKDRFAIDENLFIDTQYDIEDLSDEETTKSFKKEQDLTTKKEKIVIEKPKVFLNVTYKTILDSFEKTKIHTDYHKLLSVLNLTINDYENLKDIFHLRIKNASKDIQNSNMIEFITENLKEKIRNIKTINDLEGKLNLFLKAIQRVRGIGIDNKSDSIIVPDEKDARSGLGEFILFHNLLIEKSFWMLIPEKNQNFLNYLIERILEIIDEANETIKYYITKEEAYKSEVEENFEKTIGEIIKEYYSSTELSGENEKKIIQTVMETNNLKKSDPLIENSTIKIVPGKEYIDNNSLGILWNKIGEEKRDIFTLFQNESNINNIIILLLSAGSKGLIQYLFVAALLLIFKQKNESTEFKSYLTDTSKDKDFNRPYIKKLTDELKEQIMIDTKDFDSKTHDPHRRLLQYIWYEYKTIHTKRKSIITKAKDMAKKAASNVLTFAQKVV